AKTPDVALTLATESRIPRVQSFLARRIAAAGTPEAIAMLIKALSRPTEAALRVAILRGLNDALAGRRRMALPDGWSAVSAELTQSQNAEVRTLANSLAVTFGDPAALAAARRRLADRQANLAERRATLETLVKVHDPALVD